MRHFTSPHWCVSTCFLVFSQVCTISKLLLNYFHDENFIQFTTIWFFCFIYFSDKFHHQVNVAWKKEGSRDTKNCESQGLEPFNIFFTSYSFAILLKCDNNFPALNIVYCIQIVALSTCCVPVYCSNALCQTIWSQTVINSCCSIYKYKSDTCHGGLM